MKKKTTQKKISYLDYMCIKGERVQWNDVKGNHYEGILIGFEYTDIACIATIKMDDGSVIKQPC